MEVKKQGKIASMIELLKTGSFTVAEIIEKTGAGKATVITQLNKIKAIKTKTGDVVTYTLSDGKSS